MSLDPSPESWVLGPSICVLTAPGRGAVAVVRVWGPGALALADRTFRPVRGKALAESSHGRLRVGRFGSGLGDEVVAVVIEGEPSEVEIQCHGGSAAVALVVEALVAGGGRVRPPRAWARFSSGSALRAEAALALASAPTARVAEIMLDQLEGALDEELRRVLDVHPYEALNLIDRLIERSHIGIRLVEGWRVVLAGRPNVGKSRLLNALAGFDRSIVAASPGTTRDVVTVPAAFEGWPVELADTAGLRSTFDPIEAEGVAMARTRQRAADLVVVVLDRSEPLDELDRAILHDHPVGLVVANKSDLPAAWDELTVGALAVSAERGDGVETLVEAVARRIVPMTPEVGSGVPFRQAHLRRLLAIRECYRTDRVERGRRSLMRWIGIEDRSSPGPRDGPA
jgi:tRNA modification GTPase